MYTWLGVYCRLPNGPLMSSQSPSFQCSTTCDMRPSLYTCKKSIYSKTKRQEKKAVYTELRWQGIFSSGYLDQKKEMDHYCKFLSKDRPDHWIVLLPEGKSSEKEKVAEAQISKAETICQADQGCAVIRAKPRFSWVCISLSQCYHTALNCNSHCNWQWLDGLQRTVIHTVTDSDWMVFFLPALTGLQRDPTCANCPT